MCTLIFLNGVIEEVPMIIAANRDEFYRRPATRPRMLPGGILSGLDIPSGGTWLGVTRAGLFVALTNQRTGNFSGKMPGSRGRVAQRCLELGHIDAIEEHLKTLRPGDFNPFNLAYGDYDAMRLAYFRKDRDIKIVDVPKGVSVLPNDELESHRFQKVERAKQILTESDDIWGGLQAALADHKKPKLAEVPWSRPGTLMPKVVARRLDAMCVHAGVYGTRSSAIVGLKPRGVERFLYSEGPACRAGYEDYGGRLLG